MKLNNDILNYLKESKQETLDLLKTLCQIPAPSGKEEKRVEFVKTWLESAGAKGVYVDQALNVIYPVNCDGRDDITVFMAHTDVVFPDLTPLPFSEDEEKMYAPGIGDDTACLVLMLMTIKYILKKGLTPDCGILFVANSCEEGLGNLKGVRQLMQDYTGRVKELITFDGGYKHIVDRCVGSHRYELTFTTIGGHSFGAFGNPNAIAIMSELITNLYKCEVPKKPNCKTTYNVGIVEGGTSVNTIAQKAKMLYEYRSDDKECMAYMENFFKEEVRKMQEKGTANITVNLIGDRPCGGDVDMNKLNALCEKVISVCEKHSGVPCLRESGSTDANIPQSLGIPAICAGTHISGGTHTREEWVDKGSLEIGAKINAEIILEYFN